MKMKLSSTSYKLLGSRAKGLGLGGVGFGVLEFRVWGLGFRVGLGLQWASA